MDTLKNCVIKLDVPTSDKSGQCEEDEAEDHAVASHRLKERHVSDIGLTSQVTKTLAN